MVSFIQSNYAGFGSGVVVPGTGISLQNRGAGFSLEKAIPTRSAGGKRPFHTIIPGFLMKDGAPLMSFGVMGGPMQAQGHVQMVLRTQLWGQDPQTAVDAPRWRIVEGLDVAVEAAAGDDVIAQLAAMGHRDQPRDARHRFRLRRGAARPPGRGRLCRRLRPAQGRAGRRLLTVLSESRRVRACARCPT